MYSYVTFHPLGQLFSLSPLPILFCPYTVTQSSHCTAKTDPFRLRNNYIIQTLDKNPSSAPQQQRKTTEKERKKSPRPPRSAAANSFLRSLRCIVPVSLRSRIPRERERTTAVVGGCEKEGEVREVHEPADNCNTLHKWAFRYYFHSRPASVNAADGSRATFCWKERRFGFWGKPDVEASVPTHMEQSCWFSELLDCPTYLQGKKGMTQSNDIKHVFTFIFIILATKHDMTIISHETSNRMILRLLRIPFSKLFKILL